MDRNQCSGRPDRDIPASRLSAGFTKVFWCWIISLLFQIAAASSAFAQTTLAPATLTFGNLAVGETSAARTATMRNTQTVPLTIYSIVIAGGTAPGDYAYGGNCPINPNTLPAGKSCSIPVTFTPSALGSRSATLTVTHSATASPQSVALTGSGIAPVSISPPSLTFSSLFVGSTSPAKSVTLVNHLNTELPITSVAASGDFAVASNTCGPSVGVGLKCAIGVTFTPTALSLRQGTLTINYSAFGSPTLVALSGTGNDSGLTSITLTPANSSIAVGITDQFTATGHLRNGSTENLTPFVTWSSSVTGVATIGNASGSQGLATAAGVGSATIQAALGTIDGSTSLSVAAGFVLTGSLNTARFAATATLLNNGIVLIAGGTDVNNNVLASAEQYDPISSTFTLTGNLNTARYDHTATLLNNGMVLIAGGDHFDPVADTLAPTASAELYDPATGTFTQTGSLSTARYGHTATLLSTGLVLIAGGVNPPITSNGFLASAELYDPATGNFTPTGSMNAARDLDTATLLNNGMVLIVGGPDINGNPSSSAELYNPATGVFSLTGNMNEGHWQHTAALLNSGMVLIAGGQTISGVNTGDTASAELYDTSSGIFSITGSLNTARRDHTATLLDNGMVLIAGGDGSSGSFSSAELYNPATGTFSITGSMNTPRTYHTATLLNKGMVLVAGGSEADLDSAELFEPGALTPVNLVSIAVTPGSSMLSPGGTQQFIATGTFADGSKELLASVTWTSSDATAAQISNDASNHGTALAVAAGTVTITATAGTVSGSATLTVTNP